LVKKVVIKLYIGDMGH